MNIIKKTRDLLSDPAKWTKGAWARNADGETVGCRYKGAVCWCLDGALRKHQFEDDSYGESYYKAVKRLISITMTMGYETIPEFNDDPERTHAEVLALLDKALES